MDTVTEGMNTVRKSALDRVDKVQKEAEVREGGYEYVVGRAFQCVMRHMGCGLDACSHALSGGQSAHRLVPPIMA